MSSYFKTLGHIDNRDTSYLLLAINKFTKEFSLFQDVNNQEAAQECKYPKLDMLKRN